MQFPFLTSIRWNSLGGISGSVENFDSTFHKIQRNIRVDSNATWHGNVHFWGYFCEYTTKIASTHKTPIVALRDILTEIILLAGVIIVRCSPKPASGPEVGLWRPSCTRAMQGMCGVLPTPPHTFACVPGLVPAQS